MMIAMNYEQNILHPILKVRCNNEISVSTFGKDIIIMSTCLSTLYSTPVAYFYILWSRLDRDKRFLEQTDMKKLCLVMIIWNNCHTPPCIIRITLLLRLNRCFSAFPFITITRKNRVYTTSQLLTSTRR